jgi:hypothetical protein
LLLACALAHRLPSGLELLLNDDQEQAGQD